MLYPFKRRILVLWGLPLLASATAVALLFVALLLAAAKADEAARLRQQELLQLVVANLQSSVAHNQESATVWDDAVTSVKNRDRDWMTANLGEWMHTYFAHDAALVLSSDNALIYDFIAAPQAAVSALAILDTAQAMTLRLRSRLVRQEQSDSAAILSIGESDLVNIGARAAIVSVKPIVSDSGIILQEPGTEALHIAVRYLDGVLVERMAIDYQFSGLTFTRTPLASEQFSSVPLRSKSGLTIGYFQWQPFSPGSSVIGAVSPVIVVVGLLVFCLMSWLMHVIWRRSRSLAVSQRELRRLALHDALTGLGNRTTFTRSLDRRLSSSGPDSSVAVLFVDLDHFKAVNDSYGHPTGDLLIKEVALRLKAVAPEAEVCRLGGDEFTLVLQADDVAKIEHLAEALVACLRSPFLIDGRHIAIGASVGISVSSPGVPPTDLIRHADIALYHAKAAGRNTYAVFGTHMEELLRKRRMLEDDLKKALDGGTEIAVHYQPVYSALDGRISSLEALCRWNHPTIGPIAPDIFIPIAEEAGLIHSLGLHVLTDACSLLAELDDQTLTIAVNASAIELMSPAYPLQVLKILAAFSVEPKRLEIEITERVATDADGRVAAAMTTLREVGIRFAVDDFGKGNASFAQLLHLPVDRIKIDKMFVDGIHDGGGRPLVDAIVQMARHKGLKTTAEGIETLEQRQTLISLGCDHLQGFQLSRPLRRDQVASVVVDGLDTKRTGERATSG